MKRIITLFMALLLLAGCSGKKDKEPTISVPKEETPAKIKEEEIIEEKHAWHTLGDVFGIKTE